MIFDTDILIWIQRGNGKAATLVEKAESRYISIQTYMELLQCATNKTQLLYTRNFLKEFDFIVLPFTENIGHRAAIYIEELSLSSGLRSADALIAATAVEHVLPLCTANIKHFKMIRELELKTFKP